MVLLSLLGRYVQLHYSSVFVSNQEIHSRIGKWGGQLKTTKREIRDFFILEFQATKKVILIS